MSKKYEFTMLTLKDCGHCNDAKIKLKDKIDSGKIRVIDLDNGGEGMALANKYQVKDVPTILVKDIATQITEVCQLSITGENVVCKNKEVDL